MIKELPPIWQTALAKYDPSNKCEGMSLVIKKVGEYWFDSSVVPMRLIIPESLCRQAFDTIYNQVHLGSKKTFWQLAT